MLLDIIGYTLILIGVFFVFTGSLGVVRFPDFYTRLHPAGVTDSFGAPLALLGVVVLSGWSLFSGKVLLLMLFLLITGPTATHAIAKAAGLSGLKPYQIKKKGR